MQLRYDRMKKLGQPLALKAARLHHTAGNVIKVYNNEFLIVDMDEYSKKAHTRGISHLLLLDSDRVRFLDIQQRCGVFLRDFCYLEYF